MAYTPQNPHAGFYAYNKSILFNIVTQSVYHPFYQVTASDLVAGQLLGWTFYAGRSVDANIANEINPSGAILQIECSAAHGLVTNDIVCLANMNNAGHNGVTKVTYVDDTKFNCQDITYVAGAGASAGVVREPAYLKASAGSAGVYFASMTIDGTAAGSNKAWKWELNTNILANDNIVTERTTTNTLASMTAAGHIVVAAGDKVWISGKNTTDTSDYTVKNMNLNLHKI